MKKITKILILSLAFVLLFGAVTSFAYVAYDTYTYSISGKQMLSPTAYSTNTSITSTDMGLGSVQLKEAMDVVTDEIGNVYIADAGNNRIVVLNKYYRMIKIIDTYYDDAGKEVKFNHPEGVFVTDPSKTAGPHFCEQGNPQLIHG